MPIPDSASSLTPLETRIREIVLNGLGSPARVLTAGAFDYQPGTFRNSDEELARGVLYKPQLVARVRKQTNKHRVNENNGFTFVDIEVDLELAYHSKADLMPDERQELEVQVWDDALNVRRALNAPGALDTTEAGETIGLVSGLLTWQRAGAVSYDYGNALVKNVLTFTGIVQLSLD